MIYNQNIDLLINVDVVCNFISTHKMASKKFVARSEFSLILYRNPFIVEFHDALIENYLEINLIDLNSNLRMEGGSALGCSLDMGMQNLIELRNRDLSKSAANELFLSYNYLKTRNLYSNLEAISKLLPIIESRGGLSSLADGTFDVKFDFKDSIKPITPQEKNIYLNHIN